MVSFCQLDTSGASRKKERHENTSPLCWPRGKSIGQKLITDAGGSTAGDAIPGQMDLGGI